MSAHDECSSNTSNQIICLTTLSSETGDPAHKWSGGMVVEPVVGEAVWLLAASWESREAGLVGVNYFSSNRTPLDSAPSPPVSPPTESDIPH